ncbi:unnamed protein product [Thelazia callipaeda]|uniref:CRAL-TRIO domain-containing protein n=1 Tax=Thelazia callipaeda TaxID=103827 RepID=A0A0N5D469_THECL|nr:unnamed protein product [Thelazia callipaeda]
MPRTISTNFGEPLSTESKRLINEVRLKINQPIHPGFDNDFNIYRFVLACERAAKKNIVDAAAKTLNNHLRIRKAFKLDDLPDISFSENPIFSKRLLPMGRILEATDNSNRLLWYVEYKTIDIEAIAYSVRTSESLRLQFLQFEHMLKRVNKQEEKTGHLSALRHIVDMNGFEINPFTMMLATNGSLAYFSQLLHYENYPELVSPVEMVNISKWIHFPYKIARAMMPDDFTERFRLYDENFLSTLLNDIKIEDIPVTLGGKNEEIKCRPATKHTVDQCFNLVNFDSPSNLETIVISPRKRRQIYVDVNEDARWLQWYFTTDGDINFGVFYEAPDQKRPTEGMIMNKQHERDIDFDELEMVYPWLKLVAKLVPEMDKIECTKPGRYWIIICNKSSWIHRKKVSLLIQLVDKTNSNVKRCHCDGTFSNSSKSLTIDYLL